MEKTTSDETLRHTVQNVPDQLLRNVDLCVCVCVCVCVCGHGRGRGRGRGRGCVRTL